MATEDEITRAARRSLAWKARQAEIAEAARADAEMARRRRAVRDGERAENAGDYVWRNVVFALLAAAVGLLFLEQQAISDRANQCLAGAARPGQYRCADQVAASSWFWMLGPDTRTLIEASRADGR